jgi:hypothetical protein
MIGHTMRPEAVFQCMVDISSTGMDEYVSHGALISLVHVKGEILIFIHSFIFEMNSDRLL